MPFRFGIDHDMDGAELNRREAYERMFSRAPARLLSAAAIDAVMQQKGFFCLWNHLDATVEYALNASTDTTAVYFQRDWSKTGLLRTPYSMCISEPGVGKFYFRVRSVVHVRRALARWGLGRETKRAKAVKKE